MPFRVRYETKGGYTHCRLFATDAGADGTWQYRGRFSLRNEEFAEFRNASPRIEFRPEQWTELREASPIEETK